MLRFPNPGSDISAFVRTYQSLFRALHHQSGFTLDDISKALIASNLATSSGHIGQEALKRSTRPDRSLDPLFNQSKMYSELFRILGWIHPAPGSKQRFVFSYLGAHIGLAESEPTLLVKECLLGIAYPNPYVEIKGSNLVRPISLIMLTAVALDGRITRDEIILGPMDIDDDRHKDSIDEMIDRLRLLRANPSVVNDTLTAKAVDLGIQVNTLHNYTRFPLGVLRWAGWTRPERNSGLFHVLTIEGMRLAVQLKNYYDIRTRDLKGFTDQEIDSFLQIATYRMLERAGYSLTELISELITLERNCHKVLSTLKIADTKLILFSPFQEWDPIRLEKIFTAYNGSSEPETSQIADEVRLRPGRPLTKDGGHVGLQDVSRDIKLGDPRSDVINRIQHYATIEHLELDEIVEKVVMDYKGTSKDKFYPAIEALFCFLGYNCEQSRIGVNYQRMDALILDDDDSVPIEIKSPNEQHFISVKGVRQALENKIVLVGRHYAKSKWDTTSLVVGYELPPDRSEVSNLVQDIYDTYKISIGVIDFRSLVNLAIIRLLLDKSPKADDFSKLRGIIQISDT